MKNDRREKILEIIAEVSVETQEQLLKELERRGIRSTQATISRDIKQLHLIKEPNGRGGYRYAVSTHKVHLNFAERQRTIFKECFLNIDHAQNIVVIKTLSGMANAAAAALDSMAYDQIVGSLAGDDTVLLVLRDSDAALDFCTEVRKQL